MHVEFFLKQHFQDSHVDVNVELAHYNKGDISEGNVIMCKLVLVSTSHDDLVLAILTCDGY